nr:EOG090X0AV2 [Lepidurus arcticus]
MSRSFCIGLRHKKLEYTVAPTIQVASRHLPTLNETKLSELIVVTKAGSEHGEGSQEAVPIPSTEGDHWSTVEASPGIAMEYKVHVDPGKEECYYQSVQAGATIYVSFQVLRGGDGMAGFAVRNPQGQLVHPYQWKPASEYQEVSPIGGYYAICVDNQFSRFAAKLVNLYMTTFRYDQWEKYTQELKDADIGVESFTSTLSGVDKRVQEMLQYQQLSRGREARDFNILEANNGYVQYWSLAQCSVIILATTVQVYFVKKLFETKSGGGMGRF